MLLDACGTSFRYIQKHLVDHHTLHDPCTLDVPWYATYFAALSMILRIKCLNLLWFRHMSNCILHCAVLYLRMGVQTFVAYFLKFHFLWQLLLFQVCFSCQKIVDTEVLIGFCYLWQKSCWNYAGILCVGVCRYIPRFEKSWKKEKLMKKVTVSDGTSLVLSGTSLILVVLPHLPWSTCL